MTPANFLQFFHQNLKTPENFLIFSSFFFNFSHFFQSVYKILQFLAIFHQNLKIFIFFRRNLKTAENFPQESQIPRRFHIFSQKSQISRNFSTKISKPLENFHNFSTPRNFSTEISNPS